MQESTKRRDALGGSPVPLACALLLSCLVARAAGAAASLESLKELSVEDLLEVEVYSASRRLEPTQAVPSAIYVLTQEDIRRSHATTIPEALRLVPGVQVGRVDANKWAVSMRGFNSREANKLLVLVDGRSIYDQLFSGMLWESQDLMLEDVDRIEVIRGPGGTLWGANAVNGIINIITRHARDTQGGLAAAAAGDELQYSAALRYGWQPADAQYLRVYAKGYERGEGYSRDAPAHDGSDAVRGGFRWDWDYSAADQVRVSGDTFRATTGLRELAAPTPPIVEVQDVRHRGTNLLASWSHQFAATNGITLQAYFDRLKYGSETFDQLRKVYDLEFQQNLQLLRRHELVWGLGYRRVRDDTSVDFFGLITIVPPRRDDATRSVFVQDTFSIVPGELALTLGAKYEDTDYARAQVQPNVRLAWTPTTASTLWASASRAVRVPSRLESDLTYFGTLRPGDTLEPERVTAYELGARQLFSATLWLDLATFYNDYDDLGTSESNGQLGNTMAGHAWGGEAGLRWNPAAFWRLDASYSYLRMNLRLKPGSLANPALPPTHEGLAPRHQAVLRSGLNLPLGIGFDAAVRHVGKLPTLDYPAYTTLDLGLSWQATRRLELSIAGQNLLDSPHPEQDFVFSSSGVPTEVTRSVFGRIAWQF